MGEGRDNFSPLPYSGVSLSPSFLPLSSLSAPQEFPLLEQIAPSAAKQGRRNRRRLLLSLLFSFSPTHYLERGEE